MTGTIYYPRPSGVEKSIIYGDYFFMDLFLKYSICIFSILLVAVNSFQKLENNLIN